jgi:hypothetical protein
MTPLIDLAINSFDWFRRNITHNCMRRNIFGDYRARQLLRSSRKRLKRPAHKNIEEERRSGDQYTNVSFSAWRREIGKLCPSDTSIDLRRA